MPYGLGCGRQNSFFVASLETSLSFFAVRAELNERTVSGWRMLPGLSMASGLTSRTVAANGSDRPVRGAGMSTYQLIGCRDGSYGPQRRSIR